MKGMFSRHRTMLLCSYCWCGPVLTLADSGWYRIQLTGCYVVDADARKPVVVGEKGVFGVIERDEGTVVIGGGGVVSGSYCQVFGTVVG